MAEDRWKQLARETYETLPLAPTSTYRAMEALALRVAREAWREGAEAQRALDLREVNAEMQTAAVSRDRARLAGRVFVIQCRESEVEVLARAMDRIRALPLPEPEREK